MLNIISIVIILVTTYELIINYLEYLSTDNIIPVNVRDVYSNDEFKKWQLYQKDNCRLNIIRTISTAVLEIFLLYSGIYIAAGNIFVGNYLPSMMVMLVYIIAEFIFEIPFNRYKTMNIEQKYGFNRTDSRTFIMDEFKELFLSVILSAAFLFTFILFHRWIGNMLPFVLAILLMLFVFLAGFLYPYFSRIFNNFTDLEDGELRQKLVKMLKKYGYDVREIKIMDASRRTTKANAYFSGFGKTKTIVLYDNLINSASTDEICAIFAHEMGHGLHKDTLKNNIVSFVVMFIIGFTAWILVSRDDIYRVIGFDGINYGFAAYLLMTVLAFINPMMSILRNFLSRRAEYKADGIAVQEGLGEELICALKNLYGKNYGNLAPHRLTVAIEYSHPTLSDRIAAIEAKMNTP